MSMYDAQDPTTQFPRPPFPPQQQNAPGDIHAMDPAPDHGETSYIGFGRLPGRKALVTGADSGIGRAVAIAYAREGADVALSYLPEEQAQAEEVAALIEKEGRKAVLLPGDLQQEKINIDVVERAVDELGGLDILVINAGTMPTVDSIDDFETHTLDHVVKANIYPLFWLTKAASAHLKPGAAIITTSSVQGFQPSPSLAEYAVSKAGIANWTRAMSQQLIERGIRVNGVAPGPIWTPLQPAYVPNEKIEEFGSQTPIGRAGQPVELAPAFVFLASQESSYVVGETIAVTGGMPVH
ncbi:NAD(P)-dependent dehydrogenase (short-subunit alcohol dehydrogenase family) [Microbacterium sp. SORGH_AS428]|uniref:SDR family oxidoreductase n=1 Tax=Microbacterium sp. SORGH_AS_0428 TaxID=3041788 RepID=UPI00285D556A|nr:SDR family oxidoreductase [Microbacterium sp. SORGH_AS_0428]MDR6200696.1 NAD(P)-dependent dehydrogenase (short-subunit alcohol dehydrogenase family) [Microbacterium sp. SORGH_AS_0428]